VHSNCGDLFKKVSGGALVLTSKTLKNQLLTSDASIALKETMAMAMAMVEPRARECCAKEPT
jgi:hypothetical protein